jgi:hypothetical protein
MTARFSKRNPADSQAIENFGPGSSFFSASGSVHEDRSPLTQLDACVSLESAINIVLQCTPRYRIPEPLRQARVFSKGSSRRNL